MEAHNFVLRIYNKDKLIEQKFVPDLKVAAYFVQSAQWHHKGAWGEAFKLNPDDGWIISSEGEIETATDKGE